MHFFQLLLEQFSQSWKPKPRNGTERTATGGGFPTFLRRRKNALLLSGVLIVPFTVTAEFGRADGVRLEVTNTRPQ
jgi:hypothetical protein